MDADTRDHLLQAARDVQPRAYAPYSNFHVGAALLGESGAVYAGCNVENSSYPVSLCAERGALAAAVAAGERSIRAVAIVADAPAPCPPCGMCRQALAEFGPRMEVVLAGSGGQVRELTLDLLLPDHFGPDFLNRR
jgi:cytidine deaminase